MFSSIQEAATWLSSLPYVMDKIGLHGNSLGGLVALIMARESSKVSFLFGF